MGWTNLKRIVAPATTPITVFELMDWLRIDAATETSLLTQLINDAVDFIEGPNGIGIAMVSQQWELHLDKFPSCISVPLTPVISIDSISYKDTDGQIQAFTDYDSDVVSQPARIVPSTGSYWPSTQASISPVTVTFTAGYTSVPGDIKRAIALLAGHWYENRTATADKINEIPFGVMSILAKYSVGRFG